ncbi:uncharacterized protein LOC143297826 [Babylonia areolata]|uniref:uncharacterized protein LOC143297826 n=1 Tax=Babylonia areolata TaxID=304850 RepID=UPI003FD1C918
MIPTVDIGAFLEAVQKEGGENAETVVSLAQNQPEVKKIARIVHDAISEYGFCFFTNHRVPENVLDRAFSTSKQFYELDVKVKEKYARGHLDCHGWSGLEKEMLLNDRKIGDMKESFNFTPGAPTVMMPNEVPDLIQSYDDMFHSFQELSLRVFDLIGIALELEDPTLLSKTHKLIGQKGNHTTMRSLYYPPYPLKEGQLHCGEHHDYGSISLLFMDDVGGLQILEKDGEYHDVTPVPGAVMIFVGDMLQRWTADRYPATKHRVVIPTRVMEQGRTRQSMAFFCVPDDDTLITCLDGSNKYPPVTAYDRLMSIFAATKY